MKDKDIKKLNENTKLINEYANYVAENLNPVYTQVWCSADMAGDAVVHHDFHIRLARVQDTAAQLAYNAGLDNETHMHDQLSGLHEEMARASALLHYEDRAQMTNKPEDKISARSRQNVTWPPDLAGGYCEVPEKRRNNEVRPHKNRSNRK